MSRIEQNASQNIRNYANSAFFITGTTLAKPPAVKKHITYKDVTLILGILVAMIIAFTLWIRTPGISETSPAGSSSLPAVPKPPSVTSVIELTVDAIGKAF
jgi:hypothetical protein